MMKQNFSDSEDDELYGAPRRVAKSTRTAEPTADGGAGVEPSDNAHDVDNPTGKTISATDSTAKPGVQTSHSGGIFDQAGGAYERIKRQLILSKGDTATKSLTDSAGAADARASDHSPDTDEEAIPIKRKQHQRRDQSSKSFTPVSRSRQSSPGLFLSPAGHSPRRTSTKQAMVEQGPDSDSELPADPTTQSRLQELVARKRAERLAKDKSEKADREKRQKRLNSMRRGKMSPPPIGASESEQDEDVGKKLTQMARPSRKASKKALEDMNRETQRLSRNQQLTHEAKTKRKFSKQDFFARFNFGHPIAETENESHTATAAGSSSPAKGSSDAEAAHVHDTPPTSPATGVEPSLKPSIGLEAEVTSLDKPGIDEDPKKNDADLPDLASVLSQRPQGVDKRTSTGRIPDALASHAKLESSRPIQARVVRPSTSINHHASDSDDELEIVSAKKPSRIAIFDKLPTQKASESQSLRNLRTLAHLTSPGKAPKGPGRQSMTPAQLQASLCERARRQARLEREQKLDELKARGIIIQSREEKEKDQLEIENLVEKARQEAMELSKKEKADSKNNKGATTGQQLDDGNDEDEDEDEDWEASEPSGSEEADDADGEGADAEDSDEEEDPEESEDEAKAREGSPLIDDEAEEDMEDEEPIEHSVLGAEDIQAEQSTPTEAYLPANSRRKRVIEDEDDEEEPAVKVTPSNDRAASPSGSPDVFAAFGFDAPPLAPLGLTQAFACTMPDQIEENDAEVCAENLLGAAEKSLGFQNGFPSTDPPDFDIAMPDVSQDFLVRDSQSDGLLALDQGLQKIPCTPEVDQNLSHFRGDMPQEISPTQVSEMPDPTQDGHIGLGVSQDYRIPPVSTVETVIVPVADSPVVKRNGRLRRRTEAIAIHSDPDDDLNESGSGSESEDTGAATAFDVMHAAAARKAKVTAFDKSKSFAKDIVDEQAVESEDEYAGIGGQSDDESDGVDEEVQKMIDDTAVKVDERRIAAHFA